MKLFPKRHKNSKLLFYVKNAIRQMLPASYFQNRCSILLAKINRHDRAYIEKRVDYYLKHDQNFSLSKEATTIKDFKMGDHSVAYFYDLKEYLNYFDPEFKFDYLFGDIRHVEPFPNFVKSRPVGCENSNSVLFKLNKVRHFNFIQDRLDFSKKKNQLVWRGAALQAHRIAFVTKFWNQNFCNIGQTNKPVENIPWQKDFLSIEEQLQYKFILCIEGYDVATNLKWGMSSNSLCMQTKPKYETWFMEDTLEAGKHYVQLKEDYSDLEEKIEYYSKHTDEAESIIANAHQYIKQFQNPERENLIALSVLKKYFELSGQSSTSTKRLLQAA